MGKRIVHVASSSAGNAHIINGEILLDAGVDPGEIRDHVRLTELHGALITHEHADHSGGVEELLRAGVRVYMSMGTLRELEINHHRAHVIEAGQRFGVGNYRVEAVEAHHDAAEPVGFVVMHRNFRILYLTDTAYSKFTFAGLTDVMVECNHSKTLVRQSVEENRIPTWQRDRIYKNHFSLEGVLDLLNKSDLSDTRRIHLLHLSDSNADARKFKRKVEQKTGIPTVVARKHGGRLT